MIANALKGKLLVFSVFFTGIVAGSLGTYVYETRMANSAFASADRQRPDASKKLVGYLDLDAAQEKQLEEILRNAGVESRKLFEPIRPQIETLREESRAQIRAILSDPQKTKYEQWRAERAASRSKSKSN